MGCKSCGDGGSTVPTTNSGASGGTACYASADEMLAILSDLNCMTTQIEQLKHRTEQNDLYIREVHPDPDPVKETLCPIQTCEPCAPIGGCTNTGQMGTNKAPSGNAVGANGDSPCGLNSPATLGEKVAQNASNIRLLQQRVTALESQLFNIRNDAVQTVLLDLQGMTKGALTLTGRTVYFTPGSYEAVVNAV